MFHFYCRCVTVFLTMTKSLGCTCTKRSFGKASESYSLHGVSGVSKSVRRIPYIFLNFLEKLENKLHLDTPLVIRIFKNLSHLRAKYGKSPQNVCQFSLRGNSNLH